MFQVSFRQGQPNENNSPSQFLYICIYNFFFYRHNFCRHVKCYFLTFFLLFFFSHAHSVAAAELRRRRDVAFLIWSDGFWRFIERIAIQRDGYSMGCLFSREERDNAGSSVVVVVVVALLVSTPAGHYHRQRERGKGSQRRYMKAVNVNVAEIETNSDTASNICGFPLFAVTC